MLVDLEEADVEKPSERRQVRPRQENLWPNAMNRSRL